ncbi:MAG: protein kinase domain-containing protein, partial [Planctomycetota bacterium]
MTHHSKHHERSENEPAPEDHVRSTPNEQPSPASDDSDAAVVPDADGQVADGPSAVDLTSLQPGADAEPADILWEIFWEAIEHPEQSDQDAWVRNRCAGNEGLANQVLAMLEMHRAQPDFLETPAAFAVGEFLAEALDDARARAEQEQSPIPPPTPPMPKRIGRFRVRRVLGHGGMGVVYEAEQERPSRVVALKVIRSEFISSVHIRRFEYEAEILGRLRHPGIALVYEAGTEDAGYGQQPFFAMEYVQGQPLTDYADRARLDLRQRLELIIRICEAVHHAHQQGVVHRDLKPANILVTAEGEPKILDFGVARIVGQEVRRASLRTEQGQLIGTLPYMSPEQVEGDPAEIDTRADVYALGVLMYQLLSGRLPYNVVDRMVFDAMRVIREESPQPLSSINRTWRGDLETITAKALEKDKRRRYQSAAELANDIRRHLNHELIEARPATTWDQVVKFAQRNRAFVTGVAASFIILILGVTATTWFALEATEARALADIERQAAELNRDVAERSAYRADLVAANALLDLDRPIAARQQLQNVSQSVRGWEWSHLMARVDDSVRTIHAGDTAIAQTHFDPQRRFVVNTTRSATAAEVHVYDLASGALLQQLIFDADSPPVTALSPDGEMLAVGSGRQQIDLINTSSWKPVGQINVEDPEVRYITFADMNGEILLTAGPISDMPYSTHVVRAWNTSDSTEIERYRQTVPVIDALASGQDAQQYIVADYSNLLLFDVENKTVIERPNAHALQIVDFVFNADGSRLLTCSQDRTATLWTWPDLTPIQSFGPFDAAVMSGAFEDHGETIALGLGDGSIRVIGYTPISNAASAANVQSPGVHTHAVIEMAATQTPAPDASMQVTMNSFAGHRAPVHAIAFDPNSSSVLTASWDGSLRQWSHDVSPGCIIISTPMPYVYSARFFGERDERIAVAGGIPEVLVYSAYDGAFLGSMVGHDFEVSCIDVVPGGTRLVSGSNDGSD